MSLGLSDEQAELAKEIIEAVNNKSDLDAEQKIERVYNELNDSELFGGCVISSIPVRYHGALPAFTFVIQKIMKGEND